MDKWLIAFLFATLLAGCGENSIGVGPGGGTGAGGTNDGSPTLGITSIDKAAPTPKPTQAKAWIDRGLDLLFGTPVMAQPACPPQGAIHEFTLGDGTIWITQAYVILGEIQFDRVNFTFNPADVAEAGPFAFDLTATDDNVPEGLKMSDLNIPPGNYTGLIFDFQRIEDILNHGQPKNVVDLTAFRNRLGVGPDQRPTVWIEGHIGVGTAPSFASCTPFKFLTDKRWQVIIPFTGDVNPNTLDVVLLKSLKKAFENSMTKASELQDEIGDNLEGILDGRTKKPDWGTPNARKVTAALPSAFQVFTQLKGTFADRPAVGSSATLISTDPQITPLPN